MRLKWPKLASLAQKICTLWFQFVDALFASKGYPFKKTFGRGSQDDATSIISRLKA